MSDTLASLRRKIGGAGDLESVVRSMKALAAASIGQYEKSVLALADYYRTVELGLVVCLRKRGWPPPSKPDGRRRLRRRCAPSSSARIRDSSASSMMCWRILSPRRWMLCPAKRKSGPSASAFTSRLADAGLAPVGLFAVPTSVNAITPLVGQILVESEAHHGKGEIGQLYLFHNRPRSGATYEPVSQHLLPLDEQWGLRLAHLPWPTRNLPEVIGGREQTLSALVREYLFVSLFKACAESLASENASRLAAMQRAEKNIDELVEDLNQTFRRLRQTSIDEELFDVLSGYESLSKGKTR